MPWKRDKIIQTTYLFSILFTIAFSNRAYSQEIPYSAKEQHIQIFRQKSEELIKKETTIDNPFIIGRQHIPVIDRVNHPYFQENDWTNGTLIFNEEEYTAEHLKFDLENHKLIYLLYSNGFSLNAIELDENFVSEFTICNTKFRHFKNLKTNLGFSLKDGYYEVIYDGDLKFIVNWQKVERPDESSSYTKYKLSSSMYLLKNGYAIRIKSAAKLLKQLENKKKEVKNMMRTNKVYFNASNYSSAKTILKFYENLPKQ